MFDQTHASTRPAAPELAQAACRPCGAPLRRTFVDLGRSPLCESYVRAEQLAAVEPFSSDLWVAHARAYVDMAVERFGLDGTSHVIEVAGVEVL